MAPVKDGTDDGGPTDPENLLPEGSVLSFEEYVDMQRAIGDPSRFKVLYLLKNQGAMSPTELGERLDVRGNNLHYHLDRLVDVGLVENRKENTPDSDGIRSYYRATAIGVALLDHGVEELMRRERTFRDAYAADE